MIPQIDCLRKMSHVLRVSTHIYGVSKVIDEKMFIFKVNLGMWPLESIVSEKRALLSGFQHIYGVSEEIDGKMFIFLSKPRHVTPQIDHLRKTSPVLRVSTHIYGVSKVIDGKMFIFKVNLCMWPLKFIISENQALF